MNHFKFFVFRTLVSLSAATSFALLRFIEPNPTSQHIALTFIGAMLVVIDYFRFVDRDYEKYSLICVIEV